MTEPDPTKVLLVEGDPTDAFLVKNFLATDARDAFAVTHVRHAREAL